MTDEFVTKWGFCPHVEQLLETNSHLCRDCQDDPSQRSFSFDDASTLNHERQVAIFGWCACEGDGAATYDDCP